MEKVKDRDTGCSILDIKLVPLTGWFVQRYHEIRGATEHHRVVMAKVTVYQNEDGLHTSEEYLLAAGRWQSLGVSDGCKHTLVSIDLDEVEYIDRFELA